MPNLARRIIDATRLGRAVRLVSATLVVALAVMATAAIAAEVFAPVGTKATLSVDYVYESAGQKRSEGMYDPYEWRVKRSANLVAELAAQTPTAMPSVQPINESQMEELKGMSVEKMMAKCGSDQACLVREAQKMAGAAPAGSPDGPKYQAWRPTAQKGTYLIDEAVHISSPDPICTSLPRHRCTRDEVRKGSGEIKLPPDSKGNKGASAGFSAVEVDVGKNTLTVWMPVPMVPLPYTETITTDEPAGTHDTPTPKGPHQKLLGFRVNAAGGGTHDKPFTVPLKGSWRSQSGEQVMDLKGEFGDAGKLTVRWRFIVQ